jgi:hypothetical protein
MLRVAVRDDNPALPVVGHHPDLTAESGRGLLLVSTLADDWGVESTEKRRQGGLVRAAHQLRLTRPA